jgi:hypothetical protein
MAAPLDRPDHETRDVLDALTGPEAQELRARADKFAGAVKVIYDSFLDSGFEPAQAMHMVDKVIDRGELDGILSSPYQQIGTQQPGYPHFDPQKTITFPFTGLGNVSGAPLNTDPNNLTLTISGSGDTSVDSTVSSVPVLVKKSLPIGLISGYTGQ